MERLRPEIMAVLAEAALCDTTSHYHQLARQLGISTMGVYRAIQRLRAVGGWYTPLVEVNCLHCGQPMFSRPPGPLSRKLHSWCRLPRIRQQHTGHHARFRARVDSATLQQVRDAQAEWQRRRWPNRPADERQLSLERLHEVTKQAQAITRELAENRGARWTSDEDEYMLTHRHLSYRDIALTLGRSTWAVHARLKNLAKLGIKVPPAPRSPGGARRRSSQPATQPHSLSLNEPPADSLPTSANRPYRHPNAQTGGPS